MPTWGHPSLQKRRRLTGLWHSVYFNQAQACATISIKVLQKLVDNGNSMIIIEHNLDLIKVADYIIDLGLDGGKKGGQLIFEGTPEELIKNKKSYTAPYLKEKL